MIENINYIILIILVILAMYFDLTSKKIPNKITFPVMILGFLINVLTNGFLGITFSVVGFIVGLLIYMIPFILGGMGAGDVKMLAAIGSLMGWEFVLYTAVFAGLIGGVLVLIYLVYKRQLLTTLRQLLFFIIKPLLFVLSVNTDNVRIDKAFKYVISQEKSKEKYYVPYGVAIGLGALLVIFV